MSEILIKAQHQGESMLPTLRPGDTLVISKKKDLETGDIAVFKDGEEFVSHRIISLEPFILKGDRSLGVDHHISQDHIIGVVTALERNQQFFKWGLEGQHEKRLISKLSHSTQKTGIKRKIVLLFIYLLSCFTFLLYRSALKKST